jgi:hypothetical protein
VCANCLSRIPPERLIISWKRPASGPRLCQSDERRSGRNFRLNNLLSAVVVHTHHLRCRRQLTRFPLVPRTLSLGFPDAITLYHARTSYVYQYTSLFSALIFAAHYFVIF